MRDAHKAGRPPIHTDSFYLAILNEYNSNNSYRQIAINHRVSRTSVGKWLKRARQIQEAQEQEAVEGTK